MTVRYSWCGAVANKTAERATIKSVDVLAINGIAFVDIPGFWKGIAGWRGFVRQDCSVRIQMGPPSLKVVARGSSKFPCHSDIFATAVFVCFCFFL